MRSVSDYVRNKDENCSTCKKKKKKKKKSNCCSFDDRLK